MKLHYVLPMAGRGSRFKINGYTHPKPLIEIYEKPFFYWATESIKKFIEVESLTFVVLREHVSDFDIDKKILHFYPEANVYILDEVTEGAVITGLEGISGIRDDIPVLFNDCDHLFKSSEFNAFCLKEMEENKGIDGVLLTFNSNQNNYSYVGKDLCGNVIQTVEKKAISDEAICGCYYFRNVSVYRNYTQKYLKKCQYNEFYMSGVYNVMIEDQLVVRSMKTDFHVPFGVPDEYKIALLDESYKELM